MAIVKKGEATTIRVSKKTAQALKKLKIYEKETPDDVLERLLKDKR